MIKKILNGFFMICTLAGFLIVLGAAGSLELGAVGFGATIIHSLIGIGIVYLGFRGLEWIGSEYVD